MKSAKPVEIVIAGLGRAGWDIHWRQLLRDLDLFKVVGVIEPMAERRHEAEAEIGCPSFANFAEFLSRPVGELVSIATPSGEHGQEALACLEHGLHVVVDKPMCQGVDEADSLMAMARRKKRILTCYHPYRFDSYFVNMREIISSGKLGRIVEIKCNRSSFHRRNDWIMKKAKGGGLHNVWGSHTIDQCLHLAQSPVKDMFSDLQCTVTPGDADDHCKIVIRCENGIIIDAENSNCMIFPPQPEWMVAGTCGGMSKSPDGLHVKYFDPLQAPPISLIDGPAVDRKYGNQDVLPWQELIIPDSQKSGTAAFYPNVYAAIREGAALFITPESVRQTIAVLECCRQQNRHIWGRE